MLATKKAWAALVRHATQLRNAHVKDEIRLHDCRCVRQAPFRAAAA